jgi:hypothetical protein
MSTAGAGLSIPKIIGDCNTLRHSFSYLQGLSPDNPKVTQAVKKSFIDAIDLTNTLSQAALFIDHVKIFTFQAGHLRIVDGVCNATSAISDGAELVTEYFKLQGYYSEGLPANAEENAKLDERKCLSWMVVTKDVASIGYAVVALACIVYGVAIQSVAFASSASLVLSTVWLVMKIATYFYAKIVVEVPIAREAILQPAITGG